jgi:hypothetical protein
MSLPPENGMGAFEGELRTRMESVEPPDSTYARVHAVHAARGSRPAPGHARPRWLTRTLVAAASVLVPLAAVGGGLVLGSHRAQPATTPPATAAAPQHLNSLACGWAGARAGNPASGDPGPAYDVFGHPAGLTAMPGDPPPPTVPGCAISPAGAGVFWAPQLLVHGHAAQPGKVLVVFTNDPGKGAVLPPPAGLRVTVGAGTGDPEVGRHVLWGCANGPTDAASETPVPVNCSGDAEIRLHLIFPECWDGTVTQGDDTAHLRYYSAGHCPDGYSLLPHTGIRINYAVPSDGPPGTPMGGVTLSTGPINTLRAGMWSSWVQGDDAHRGTLRWLVDACLNGSVALPSDVDCAHV